ncbi:hypothetical protein, partial [Stenotrophomonas maltophilia]
GDPYVQVSPGTARNADGHTSASKADGSYMFIAGSDDETLGLWRLRESVSSDVEEGMDKLGYDFGQAILFAHSSLELKLENFPEEDIFALTALLACILDRGGLCCFMKLRMRFHFSLQEVVRTTASGMPLRR